MDPSRVLPRVPIKVRKDLTLETKSIKIMDWGEAIMEKFSHRIRDVGKGRQN